MWENVLVGILVTAAVVCVIIRLVKGSAGGGCGSCKCCGDTPDLACPSDKSDEPCEETH